MRAVNVATGTTVQDACRHNYVVTERRPISAARSENVLDLVVSICGQWHVNTEHIGQWHVNTLVSVFNDCDYLVCVLPSLWSLVLFTQMNVRWKFSTVTRWMSEKKSQMSREKCDRIGILVSNEPTAVIPSISVCLSICLSLSELWSAFN